MTDKHILPSDKKRERLVKDKAKTNPEYGGGPNDRNVEELLNNGFVIIDKPKGPTSHQIDAWIRDFLDGKKIGHGGTLDPNATGVLPIGIGEAAKSLQFLLPAGKEYVGVMKLHKDVDKKQIRDVCKGFVGIITQLPPLRSAVKRVRRKRHIYYLDIIQIKGREVLFRVGCESGTYVRTLCVDIGKKLKCGAHLAELRRTRVGHLKEEESSFLHDLKDAYVFYHQDADESYIRKIVLPIESMFDHLPKIVIRDSAVDSLCHGASLAAPGVVEVDSEIKKGDLALVSTLKDEGVAVVKTTMSTEEILEKDKGVCGELQRVLMKKDTYPAIWKKT